MPYPSPEEILAPPIPTFKEGTISLLRKWRTAFTGELSPSEKIDALAYLVLALADHYKKPVNIVYDEKYAYSALKKKIMLKLDNPSIISTLHEFAHHLFGASELQACRWSVWLFKKAFPVSYKKLKFKGHMLVKDKKDMNKALVP